MVRLRVLLTRRTSGIYIHLYIENNHHPAMIGWPPRMIVDIYISRNYA